MNLKKRVNFKILSLAILVILLVAGAVFYTHLLPPLNKEEAGAGTAQPIAGIGETKGVQTEKSSAQQIAAEKPQLSEPQPAAAPNSRPQQNETAYKPPVCNKKILPYKTVYSKSESLKKDETRVKIPGKNGYKQTCSPDSNGKKTADVTVLPQNQIVEVGSAVRSVVSGLAQALDDLLGSLN